MANKKAKSLKEVSQIHGKVTPSNKDGFRATSLEQILGAAGDSRFGTMNEAEYIQTLNGMSKADLHEHAAKIGLVPIDSRERLVKSLIHEFKLHVASFRTPQKPVNKILQIPPEVQKILSEGR